MSRKLSEDEIVAVFWSRVGRAGDDDCWPWAAGRMSTGYGCYRQDRAHRWAWRLTNGPIPAGLLVCHHCDNPLCCNPKHLFLGTIRDNFKDCVEKGRHSYLRSDYSTDAKKYSKLFTHFVFTNGADHPAHKLTTDDVLQILSRAWAGETGAALAREFGVAESTIHKITHGKMWNRVPEIEQARARQAARASKPESGQP